MQDALRKIDVQNQVFRDWRADLDVLLEQRYGVDTSRLGLSGEQLKSCVPLSLSEAMQEIASQFGLRSNRPAMTSSWV